MGKQTLTCLNVNLVDGSFTHDRIDDESIVGPVDYGWKHWEGGDALVFGGGPLAGSIIHGTNRMVFAGYSPVWDGFYVSTMGGAALIFDDVGCTYVALRGRAPQTSVLVLHGDMERVHVRLEPVDVEAIWAGYHGKLGFYALQDWVYERFGPQYKKSQVVAVGPAAKYTNMGAIGSGAIKEGKPSWVDTWAGRGGLGSRLLQHHNVAAVIYGGTWEDDDLRSLERVNEFFLAKYKKKWIEEDKEVTGKYYFEPKFKSGGTFGVNFSHLKDLTLFHNYTSIYRPDEERLALYERLVLNHYLKQFNDETIASKSWEACGEPCHVRCKKMWQDFKKDYEPYAALGPLSGVFDQRAAEKLNRYADAAGFDSIQIGGLVAWVMDLLDQGLVPPAELGLSARPRWDLGRFDPVADSLANADLGIEIIDRLLHHPRWEAFRAGMRVAARWVDDTFHVPARDRAVFLSNGDGGGCMVPNMYWVPGMLAPMPIMGKYFEYYGNDFLPPRALGRKNVERMVKELYSDNGGLCRFHRGWGEELLPEIANRFTERNVDWAAHHQALARELNGGNRVRYWESERVIDLLATYLTKIRKDGPKSAELDAWVARFAADKQAAARAYFDELKAGQEEGFAAVPAAAAAPAAPAAPPPPAAPATPAAGGR